MKKRVLVVDDEPDLTFMVNLALEQTGDFDVKEINEADSALSAARQFHPDLIILDVMMPGMDGGDVAQELAADPHLKHVPIVFLTATVQKGEVDKGGGMIAGRQFLPKPLEIDDLIGCVRRMTNENPAGTGEASPPC